jgi:hypothetical protein
MFMAWARRRLRFGSWLALAALAIQLALSFGHIHAEDFATTANQATVDADQRGGNSEPDRHDFGHHDCDICATIALFATLVIPSPPVLAVVTAQSVAPHVVAGTRREISATRRPFQARAPPLV